MRFSNMSLGAKLTCVSALAIAFCLRARLKSN